jgi:hypothetical protein
MAGFTVEIEGIAPLLMHSARLADPLDEATKALAKVTGKRKKTDDDHAEVSRLEFLGSLYVSQEFGPFIPGQNLEACLFKGATRTKLGTALKSALLIPQNVNPLIYVGPRDPGELWKSETFVHRASVKVGTSRVIRTRPVFPTWQVVFEGELDTEVVDQGQFENIAETAGRLVGLGDWRPRFGRFKVNSITWNN